jgi:hypothetical protein
MPEKPTEMDLFRESLADVHRAVIRLKPYCQTFEDLEGILELASVNDAQLRILAEKMVDAKEENKKR